MFSNSSFDDRISPPVGKSGPFTWRHSLRIDERIIDHGDEGVDNSVRLCGGIFVAMPTAIPDAPLTSKFGICAGKVMGSES